MPEDPQEALPGQTLLLAQRATEVRHDQQAVRHALVAKARAPHEPAAGAAGQSDLGGLGGLAIQQRVEAELRGIAAEELLGVPAEEALAGAVDDLQPPAAVECEDRRIDLRDHGPHQRRRLQRAESLLAQGIGEAVQLHRHLPHRVLTPRAAQTDRVVLLAQGANQVRQSAQRIVELRAHGEAEGDDRQAGGAEEHPTVR